MRRLIHPVTGSSFRGIVPAVFLLVAFACVLSLASPSTLIAGANPDFRIVLHGKASSFEPCNGYLPVDCVNNPPNVNVQAAPLTVFILLYHVNQGSGLQTAFEFPGWTMTFSLLDCLGGVHCNFAPCTPQLPPYGTVFDVDFNCLTTPGLHAVGRLFLVPAGQTGCVSQVIPAYPFGIHMRDCSGGIDIIDDPNSYRLGKICVGAGGVTGCDDVIPVEAATWGKIKATY